MRQKWRNINEFNALDSSVFTCVPNWNSLSFYPDNYRIYGNNIPKKEAREIYTI